MDYDPYAPPTPERLVCTPRERHRRKQSQPRQRNPLTGHWVLQNVAYSSTGRPMFIYKWWDAIVFDDGEVGWVIDLPDEQLARLPPEPQTPVVVPNGWEEWEAEFRRVHDV